MKYLICLLAMVSAGTTSLAATITDTRFNFTLVISDRYRQFPGAADSLYYFATSDPANGVPDATIAIQRLHGTIGKEHLDLSATGLPGAQLLTGQWKSFTVDVFAAQVDATGTKMAIRGAQLPLAHEAVQIIVAVPLAREASAEGILNEFLTGFDGPSNWSTPKPITPKKRGELIGEGIGRMLLTIAMLILGVGALIRFIRRRAATGK